MNRQKFFENFFDTQNSILVFDGGMGTECERLGADINHELWSTKVLLETPELIEQVHSSYLRNGADLIGTATYQLSQELLFRFNPRLTVTQVVNAAVGVAKHAVMKNKPGSKILGCVGSIGAAIPGAKEFSGDYPEECLSKEYMKNFHRERLVALIEHPAVDALLIETMPRLDEVIVILDLLKEEIFENRRKVPVFVSFSGKLSSSVVTSGFGDEIGKCFQTIAGDDEDASYEFVCAVGVNCCVPNVVDLAYKRYVEIFFANRTTSQIIPPPPPAFIGYPNSGEIFDGSDRTWHKDSSSGVDDQNFSSLGEWLAKSKLSLMMNRHQEYPMILGGCCRTTPERDIKSIAELVKR